MTMTARKGVSLVIFLVFQIDGVVGFPIRSTDSFLRSTTSSSYHFLATAAPEVFIEPKDAVRVFGRLAEKYIMLDETGGMCCYSACKDCEYRLPDGGYRMADQSSSRPKWIPVYEERSFSGQNKEHIAKWRTGIFGQGDECKTSVTKKEFVVAVVNLEYIPPLGGPFVAASGGPLGDTAAVERLFDLLADGKEKLSRSKMSSGLKKLANGEQGLTWPSFQTSLGL